MTAPTLETVNPDTVDLDDEFDLDIRIAVGADVALPEAGFTCSWFSCNDTCVSCMTCSIGCGSTTHTCRTC